MQEPLPPPPRRRRRRPGGAEDTGQPFPVAPLGRASPPPPSLEAGAPPQQRHQQPQRAASRGWHQQPPSASAASVASARPPQPPWRLSLRAALLSLGVVVALFGPCARGWRVPGPPQHYGWGGPRRRRMGAPMQPLAAIGGSQQPPQQRTSGGMVEDGQGQPPPPSSAAPPASSGGERRRDRRGGGAPPRGDSSASRSRSSPSSSVASAALRVLPGEEALVAQLEDVRQRKRRGELRGLVRRLDLVALKTQGSLAVLETLARAAGACQDAGLAWEALQCLLARVAEAAGVAAAPWAPRWDTFSLVMSACRRRRDLNALIRAFKVALPYSGHSRTVLLNILLAGLCDGGRIDVAAFYLDTAEEKWGVEPNTVSWNTLLSAAVRAGQPKLVADLEARMAARGVEGDVTTRNIHLQYLLATRPLEEALDYFDGLQREQAAYLQGRLSGAAAGGDENTVMDLRTLNILASHIARTKGFDDAAAMVGAVQRKPLGVAPRAVTHNILLDALLKAGRVDEALEYFYEVAAEAGREQQQQQQQAGQRRVRLPPVVDSTTYDILLSGLVQNGRVSTAGVVHQMMGKAGLPPTIYTFAALVRLQKSATDVYRLWAQARATCGPRLSLPFLNLLIYELGQTHGDLQGALAAFRAILRTPGLGRPNTISYNSLLSALVRDVNATVPALLAGEGDGAGSVDEEDEEEELVVVGAEAAAADIVAVAPEMGDVPVAAVLGGGGQQGAQDGLALLDALGGKPVLEAALAVLRSLYPEASPAKPNARTFTILLAGIGKAGSNGSGRGKSKAGGSSSSSALCASLYREAEAQGVECNGIMAHALIRAFGPDAPGALAFFKKELRVRLKALDKRRQQQAPPPVQEEEEGPEEGEDDMGLGGSHSHMSLAYLALLHVCGLAGRPDLALQSVYAMQRDGLRADRRAWDAFASGKDAAGGQTAAAATTAAAGSAGGAEASPASAAAASSSSSSSLLMAPYESLLRAETLGWEGGETLFKRIRIRF